MNPQEQERTPSFELPTTQPSEQVGQKQPELHVDSHTERQSSVAVEQGTGQQAAPSTPQVPPAYPQLPAQMTVPPSDDSSPSASSAATPHMADDTDLIEKEWVDRAKEIVARTAHDPHLQNKEMNKFKAGYLKKRYNKDIKLSEDES